MCGILASNKVDIIVRKLEEQSSRGLKGSGYALEGTQPITFKSKGIFNAFANFITDWTVNKPKYGMFHHRFPTSTADTNETAHPFTHPSDPLFFGIHNGVISNKNEVIPKEIRDTDWFVDNDSQAIIYELIEAIKSGSKWINRLSVGYAAVMLMDYNTNKFYYYRDEKAKLNMYLSPDGNEWLLSSEALEGQLANSDEVKPNIIYELLLSDDGKLNGWKEVCEVRYTPPAPKVTTYPKSYDFGYSHWDDQDYEYDYKTYTYKKKKITNVPSQPKAVTKNELAEPSFVSLAAYYDKKYEQAEIQISKKKTAIWYVKTDGTSMGVPRSTFILEMLKGEYTEDQIFELDGELVTLV